MSITLYYVPGINRLDEPVFDDIQAQNSFFSRFVVSTPDAGFYPPHYRNQITLSIDDITFTSAVNYLSITFDDKIYYYFIDNITYISESDIKIDITMDVIQTYMFNINFISSELTRQSIQRWNDDDTINRNYFRENLSNGLYLNKDTISKLDNIPLLCLVAKFASLNNGSYHYFEIGDTTVTIHNVKDLNSTKLYYNGKVMPDGCIYVLIPLPFDSRIQKITFTVNGYDTTYNIDDYCDIIRKLMELPELISLTIVSGIIFDKIGIAYDVILDVDNTYALLMLPTTFYNTDYTLIAMADSMLPLVLSNFSMIGYYSEYLDKVYMSYDYTFGFTISDDYSNDFDYHYCPQLLDENYYQILWGERIGFSGYPLHVLTDTDIYYKTIINPQNGFRDYWVSNSDDITKKDIIDNDYYLTLIRNSSVEYLPTYNDAYKEYQSQNYGTLTRGMALKTQQNAYNFVMGTLEIGNQTAKNMLKSKSLYSTFASLGEGILHQGMAVANAIESQYVIHENLKTTIDNLKHTPDTQSMGNVAEFDYFDGSIYPIFVVKECTNIKEVAENFESFGYKVSIITTDNILQQHIRFYYDVIQAQNVVITLTNIVNDEFTLSLIRERLGNGVRLWHTDHTNHLYIENQGYNMGNVCIFDNIEVNRI